MGSLGRPPLPSDTAAAQPSPPPCAPSPQPAPPFPGLLDCSLHSLPSSGPWPPLLALAQQLPGRRWAGGQHTALLGEVPPGSLPTAPTSIIPLPKIPAPLGSQEGLRPALPKPHLMPSQHSSSLPGTIKSTPKPSDCGRLQNIPQGPPATGHRWPRPSPWPAADRPWVSIGLCGRERGQEGVLQTPAPAPHQEEPGHRARSQICRQPELPLCGQGQISHQLPHRAAPCSRGRAPGTLASVDLGDGKWLDSPTL